MCNFLALTRARIYLERKFNFAVYADTCTRVTLIPLNGAHYSFKTISRRYFNANNLCTCLAVTCYIQAARTLPESRMCSRSNSLSLYRCTCRQVHCTRAAAAAAIAKVGIACTLVRVGGLRERSALECRERRAAREIRKAEEEGGGGREVLDWLRSPKVRSG